MNGGAGTGGAGGKAGAESAAGGSGAGSASGKGGAGNAWRGKLRIRLDLDPVNML